MRTDEQTDRHDESKSRYRILATRLKKSPEFYINNSVDFLEDPGINGRIILRMIFRKWDWEVSGKPIGPILKGQGFQGDS